jgi:NAD(P)-dependent dehydrogenase (short-subunit alcohol dehydrogenase family)
MRVMPQRTTASDRSEARLAGLVAIVTGASSGIGQGVAETLALDGASVCINYHAHSKPADELVDRIRGDGGSAIAVGADVAHEYDVISLFDQAKVQQTAGAWPRLSRNDRQSFGWAIDLGSEERLVAEFGIYDGDIRVVRGRVNRHLRKQSSARCREPRTGAEQHQARRAKLFGRPRGPLGDQEIRTAVARAPEAQR